MLESTKRDLMADVMHKIISAEIKLRQDVGLFTFDKERPLYLVIAKIEKKLELLAQSMGLEFYEPSTDIQIRKEQNDRN